jgi:rhodanese-related sulfurtransferase
MKLKLLALSAIAASSFLYAHTFKLADTVKGMGPKMESLNKMCKSYEKYVNYITPDQLKKWMKDDKDFTIVDVRSVDEMKAGEIDWPDYDEYPLGQVPVYAAMGAFKPDTTYVFLCATGHRAVIAGGQLVKWFGLNKKHVYVLRGGINGWLNTGYSVVNKVTEFGGFKDGLKAVTKPKEPVILDQF